MDSFKKRLATAMDRAKCDRARLATALGVSVQAVGAVLLGDSKALSAANTAKAARFLGVDWYWLATGEGQMEPVASWPVQRVPVKRFTDLKPDDRAFVEGRLLSAIEECEQRKRSEVSHGARLLEETDVFHQGATDEAKSHKSK